MSFGPYRASRMFEKAAQALHAGGEQAEQLTRRVLARRSAESAKARGSVHPSNRKPTFEQSLQGALDAADLQPRDVSVIAMRIDYFDVVIASHGTEIGREVMDAAQRRLNETVRSNDVCTATGLDGVMLQWSPGRTAPSAIDVAERIASQFDQPMVTSAGQLPITVSLGIATTGSGDKAAVDAATLQRQAQTAVAAAQQRGRAQLEVFDHAFEAQAIEAYRTERHLRAAVRNNDLQVAYQPIISLHSGAVVGLEALARWKDESLGAVSPSTFIPLAEESGLIGEIGRQVLQAAVQQGGTWNSGETGRTPRSMMITVNLSNRQLLDPELIPAIATVLEQNQLDPSLLCLEITESVVMSNVAASMTILGHMKDLGLCLAIDDFGTGYSSLSYLRRLPVDILKIDRSFVQSVYNRDDRVITRAIIDLAHTLGMTTVAEGVETQLQVEVLHALNCDMAQGFLLHPPTSPHLVNFDSIDFENYPTTLDSTSLVNGSRDWSSAPTTRMAPSAQQ